MSGQETDVNLEPVLRLGELWTKKDLLTRLKVSKETLGRWEAAGLQPLGYPVSANTFYLSDDVIAVMRIPASKIPKFEPIYKRKKKKG